MIDWPVMIVFRFERFSSLDWLLCFVLRELISRSPKALTCKLSRVVPKNLSALHETRASMNVHDRARDGERFVLVAPPPFV